MKNRGSQLRRYRLLAVTAVLLLSACGASDGSLRAGNQFFAGGKYRAAYIEAKKVLQHDNKDGAAWLLLGKASLMLGDPKSALDDFQKAKANGIPEASIQVPMARALLVMHKYGQLVKSIKAIDSMSTADKVQILALRGDALLDLGTPSAAKYAFQSAQQLDPKSPLPLVGLAKVALARHDVDTARKYLADALSSAPNDPHALVTKGDIAVAGGDFKEAEADYSRAVAENNSAMLPQERYYAIAKLADSQIHQNKLKAALANIETLQKMAPKDPYGHYLHGAIDFKRGRLDEAVSQLQQVLKVLPSNVPAQLMMGAVNYAQGDLTQAEMYLSNVLGVDSNNRAARNLLAVTLYREGESHQAVAMLRPILGKDATDADALAMLQQEAAAGAQVVGVHAEGTAAAPNSAEAMLGRASAAAAAGHTDEAIRLLKQMPAGSAPQEFARTRLLTMVYLQSGHKEKALGVAADYVKAHQKESDAHLLYGDILVAEGKADSARSEFLKAYQLDSKSAAALMNLGKLDVNEGHNDAARKRFEAAVKLQPKNAIPIVALGELDEGQGHANDAIRHFERAIQLAPTMGVPYVDLAVIYSRQREFKKALVVAKKYLKNAPKNPAALNAVGAAELNSGNYKDALTYLQQAVAADPTNILYRINLSRGEIMTHDFASADKNLGQVVAADPTQVRATTMLAFLKAQKGDMKAAIALANKLEQNETTRLAGQVLTGDLYMSHADYRDAAQAYESALKAQYSRPIVIKVFEAQAAAGMTDADTVLKPWLAKHPKDETVRMLLGQYYQGRQQYHRAAEQYERVLSESPNNVSAMNNLAWVYTEQNNPKAVHYAEKAYRLAPKAYAVEDTYGWALVQAGQAEKAVPILAAAADNSSSGPTIHYHLAVAQAQSGDKKGAEATLRTLLQAGAEFAEKADAEKLYEKLTTGSNARQ